MAKNIAEPISNENPPYRVLCMDGGGIYGLFTALMLRKLCQKNEDFLKGDQVTLFAGTSAGAMNALVLAKEENPRDAVLSGKLESFYRDERLYSNKLDPLTGWLSLFMLTSWSGRKDFYSILHENFGDMKMRELKHRVLITTFDFLGTPEPVFGQRRWKPKFFYNFPGEEPDRELMVKDVAYGAASPPTVRPVQNGITDGGLFAMDPTIYAIAKIVGRTRQARDAVDLYNEIVETAMEKTDRIIELLKEIKGLSVNLEMQYLSKLLEEYREHAKKYLDKNPMELLEMVRIELEFFKQLITAFSSLKEFEADKKIKDLEQAQAMVEWVRSTGDLDDDTKQQRIMLLRNLLHDKLQVQAIQLLKNISAFSVGIGNQPPNYFLENFNFGVLPFNLLPTNPTRNFFEPPFINLLLNPTTDATSFEAKQLLGEKGYFRLNPPAIGFPVPSVFSAVYLSKWRIFREFIAARIEETANLDRVGIQIDQALDWLRCERWAGKL